MRAKTWLIVAAFFLLAGGMQSFAYASPRGGGRAFGHMENHEGFEGAFHGGFNAGRMPGRIYAAPAFGFGWGWGYPGFWDPYYYPAPNVVEVHRVNYGTVEFKVKPDDTKVYVDQKFIGTVKSLDHHKAYMAAGNHDIKLTAPDGQTLDRNVYVAAGHTIKIDDKL